MVNQIMEAKILSDRAFGFTFAAVFALISVVGWFVFNTLLVWAVFLYGTFLALALIAPWILLPLNRMWMWLAHGLGNVVNFVLLSVFFFVVILPFGVAMRLLKKDPMKRKMDPHGRSYWTSVDRRASAEVFKDMF